MNRRSFFAALVAIPAAVAAAAKARPSAKERARAALERQIAADAEFFALPLEPDFRVYEPLGYGVTGDGFGRTWTVGPNRVVFFGHDGHTYCLDAKTGETHRLDA